jgi:peroxiredoxin
MAQFESHRDEFEKAGGSVWFIAAEKRRGMFDPEKFFEKHPAGYPFLLDEDRTVTKAYGVYQRMGIDAWNIARPASFVVGVDGTVRSMYVGASQTDRAPIDSLTSALRAAQK